MTTAIGWTDDTWNPVTGCTKVSPGCDHCYAERITERFSGPGSFEKVVLHEDRVDKPLHWRKPRRVFVNSMSDLFHDDVPDEFIARVFGVMGAAGQHRFQVLTKRPGRMASLLGGDRWHGMLQEEMWNLGTHLFAGPVLPNVWLGTSVESQKWADVRIPKLLKTPAAVRFLSCEPLLGSLDLSRYLGLEWMDTLGTPGTDEEGGWGHEMFAALNGRVGPAGGLHWIIVGGESGPGFRPMELDWLRSIVDQATEAGVPVFVKQDSVPRSEQQGRIPDDLWARKEYPDVR